jgi:exodeoxyribonuclease VIII
MNKDTIRVMLDLETLGTVPNSVITSIGAVKFNASGISSEFYTRVDIKSCTDLGLVIDPQTIIWWLGQTDNARLELTKPGICLPKALLDFSEWIGADNSEIWGNGASFDNVVLSCSYTKCGIERPWKYSSDRCYRTIKCLYPDIKIERFGEHHNALDDAKSQANHLISIFWPVENI